MLLLTLGEPAGIGPDCLLKLWQADPASLRGVCVVAPAHWLRDRATELGVDVAIHACASPVAGSGGAIACFNPLADPAPAATAGIASPATATAVIGCIAAAARLCLRGSASGLVTGPIEKAVLRDCGFDYPGHTEFLAALAQQERPQYDGGFVMMLAAAQLRVALLTTHLPLREVARQLSADATAQALAIVDRDLRRRFAIAAPRIALAACNPHGGEAGHFGREEIEILAPAAAAARRSGIDVSGPLPADTLFSPPQRARFDAVLCCYHDQGLIPIKALAFGEAVNVTLGLPFIRTSVDHGTAMDRAATGNVSYSSLVAAIDLARQMQREV